MVHDPRFSRTSQIVLFDFRFLSMEFSMCCWKPLHFQRFPCSLVSRTVNILPSVFRLVNKNRELILLIFNLFLRRKIVVFFCHLRTKAGVEFCQSTIISIIYPNPKLGGVASRTVFHDAAVRRFIVLPLYLLPYPSGFCFCQFQESAHMSPNVRWADHPSTSLALLASAQYLSRSPALRPPNS